MILTSLEQREKLFPLDLVNNPDKILLQNFKTGEVFQMQIEFQVSNVSKPQAVGSFKTVNGRKG